MTALVAEIIVSDEKRVGTGREGEGVEDPIRRVWTFHTTDGKFICEFDTWTNTHVVNMPVLAEMMEDETAL